MADNKQNANDLFDSPSAADDLFNKDTANSTGSELSQNLADAARGVAQGGTFGWASEIAGGGEALGDILRDPAKLDQFRQLYRQHQLESAGNFKAAQQRSPWLYGGGELAGAIGTGILSAGLGAEAGAAGAGAEAAAGAAEGAEALPEAASLGSKLLTGIKTGAGAGAAYGAGQSEGNIDTAEGLVNLAKDTAGGALAGSAAGAGGTLLAEGAGGILGGIKNKLAAQAEYSAENKPFIRQVIKSYQEGKLGNAINEDTSPMARIGVEQSSDISRLTKNLENSEQILGQQFGGAIDQAVADGVQIPAPSPDFSDTLDGYKQVFQDNTNLIGPKNTAQLVSDLTAYQEGNLNPRVVYNLRQRVMDIASKVKDPQIQSAVNGISGSIKTALDDNVPELKELGQQFYQLRRAGSETLLSKGLPSDIADVWLGDLNNSTKALGSGVTQLLESISTPGTQKMGVNRSLQEMLGNLNQFELDHPGVLQTLGINPSELGRDIRNSADKFAMSRQALGYEPQASPTSSIWNVLSGGGATTGRGTAIAHANLLGRAVKSTSSVVSPVVNLSQRLYNLPEDALYTMGDTLKDAGLTSLGEALQKGISEKNEALKNAAVFSILQNPKARLLFHGEDTGLTDEFK